MSSNVMEEEKKMSLGVWIHSFFVIPFIMVVVSLLLVTAVRLITREQVDVSGYLTDIAKGSESKCWQSAFHLSALIRGGESLSVEDKQFMLCLVEELSEKVLLIRDRWFETNKKTLIYLILAMGHSRDDMFALPLKSFLNSSDVDLRISVIQALSAFDVDRFQNDILPFMMDEDVSVRLVVAGSLGELKKPQVEVFKTLTQALSDSEVNVRWESAFSLLKLKNLSGLSILLSFFDKQFMLDYPNVDRKEWVESVFFILTALYNTDLTVDQEKLVKKSLSHLKGHDKNVRIQSVLNLLEEKLSQNG